MSKKPEQYFKGKRYLLHNGEKYFSRGTKRMHRDVYEYYNGLPPKGMHVHHIDGDSLNNDIKNLELKSPANHLKAHMTQERRDRARIHMLNISPLAKAWHKSKEGREWHKENGKKCWENKIFKDRVCAHCKKIYSTKTFDSRARFCHLNCKMKARTRRLKGLAEDYIF